MASKSCRRCGSHLDTGMFRTDLTKRDELASYCRPCESEYQKEYRRKNSDRLRQYRIDQYDSAAKSAADVKYRYGVSQEAYDRLLESQDGGCAICGKPCPSGRRLAVDHDHSCCPGPKSCGSCVRGLLCGKCNPGIGYFNDDPLLLTNAASYLQKGISSHGDD